MNPILPAEIFIPDPEARVWADGRLYIYGSQDQLGHRDYCGPEYRVYSSEDLCHWADHGVSFHNRQPGFSAESPLYAPDCIHYRGKYYLFFCQGDGGGRIGVAVSESPTGPFTDASPVAGADGTGIDPAVLVDDDGAVYLYWGQFNLKGARLNDDLRSIRPETLQPAILSGPVHGFHEGASIRKIGSIYCIVFTDISQGRATRLSQALGDTPLGSFEKKGVIIDNIDCDPMSWNNHGSICQFQNQWIIFYHRSSRSSRFHRRLCAEPITVRENGTIETVTMSLNGLGTPPAARQGVEAWRANWLYGQICTAPSPSGEILCSRGSANWAHFRSLNFRGEGRGRITLRGKGLIYINLGDPYSFGAGEVRLPQTEAWQTLEFSLNQKPEGETGVFLFFVTGNIDVLNFSFFP